MYIKIHMLYNVRELIISIPIKTLSLTKKNHLSIFSCWVWKSNETCDAQENYKSGVKSGW